ncbi:hypothetical protein [Streptomyces sp. NPDC053048]|uniref:hypothetical protein n=1 Tax=Streptomyces sp. NPDC053048 TaxID=3365694 RepID=UPI0037D4A600
MPTLQAAAAVVAPRRNPYTDDPWVLTFHRDLVEPFGATVDESLLRTGANVSHRELVDHLVRADGIQDSKPDLVVLAHALPDLHPFTAVAPHLDMLLGGGATSIGISQQGLAAPFTALRVVAAHQRSGSADRAVVAILEQTTLPTRLPLVHDTPLTDSGVLLLLGTGDGPELAGVERLPGGTPPLERAAALAAADPDRTLVVAGPWIPRGGPHARVPVRHLQPGTYCTSVWLALAREWRSWREEYSTVVLCDTDPLDGGSHLAVLRTGN